MENNSKSIRHLIFNPLSLFVLIAAAFFVTLFLYASVLEIPQDKQPSEDQAAEDKPDLVAEQIAKRRAAQAEAVASGKRHEITEISDYTPATSARSGGESSPVPPEKARGRQRGVSPHDRRRKQRIKAISYEIFEQLKKEEAITPDRLYLKSGREIQGTILEDLDTHWKVRYRGVTTTIEKSDVEKIEHKSPQSVEHALRRLSLMQAKKIVAEGLVRYGDDWITPEERDLRMQTVKAQLEIERIKAQSGAGTVTSQKPKHRIELPKQFTVGSGGIIDFSSVTVYEGRGFGDIILGHPKCTKEFIKSRLGEPDIEKEHILDYNTKYGLALIMASDMDMFIEMHLNRSFKGKLSSGITLSSTKEDIFGAYGEPIAEEEVESLDLDYRQYRDRTLYRKGLISRLTYRDLGLMFWFTDNELDQIVVGRI